MANTPTLIPEWREQSGILLVWPHRESDWHCQLREIEVTYVALIAAITPHEKVLLCVYDEQLSIRVRKILVTNEVDLSRIFFSIIPSNDTWARDFGPLTVINNGIPTLLNFQFNGWGGKFDAALDNKINKTLHQRGFFGNTPLESAPLILEGGSIEVDGNGSLMTTRSCLLSDTRNPGVTEAQMEIVFKNYFGVEKIHWIENSYLAGDDTDGHIDMLARFAPGNTIAYLKCANKTDEHFESMRGLEQELRALRNCDGMPYRLIGLPFPKPIYDNETKDRLPASFANFLIINNAVLVPQYGVVEDAMALSQLALAFPGRDMIPINARAAITQSGSLHCLSMQLPAGVLIDHGEQT